MSDVWVVFDDAGHDPLAAPDPPRHLDEPDTEDEPRIDTDWWADVG